MSGYFFRLYSSLSHLPSLHSLSLLFLFFSFSHLYLSSSPPPTRSLFLPSSSLPSPLTSSPPPARPSFVLLPLHLLPLSPLSSLPSSLSSVQAAQQGVDETVRITTFTVNGLAAAISTG